jgi:hypothetical protein
MKFVGYFYQKCNDAWKRGRLVGQHSKVHKRSLLIVSILTYFLAEHGEVLKVLECF